MESIIYDVRDSVPDKRQWLESQFGRHLEDSQKVVIRVIELGREPDEATRKVALTQAVEIARQCRAAAAAHGVTPEEADAVVEEAVQAIRQSHR